MIRNFTVLIWNIDNQALLKVNQPSWDKKVRWQCRRQEKCDHNELVLTNMKHCELKPKKCQKWDYNMTECDTESSGLCSHTSHCFIFFLFETWWINFVHKCPHWVHQWVQPGHCFFRCIAVTLTIANTDKSEINYLTLSKRHLLRKDKEDNKNMPLASSTWTMHEYKIADTALLDSWLQWQVWRVECNLCTSVDCFVYTDKIYIHVTIKNINVFMWSIPSSYSLPQCSSCS